MNTLLEKKLEQAWALPSRSSVWKGHRYVSSYLWYTLSGASVYLPKVLGEHQGGASEPTSHGPRGRRGGFMEVVSPTGGTGIVQMREAAINYQAQTIQYTHTPAKLITGLSYV